MGRLSRISRLVGTVGALWLGAAGSAWAGDGGSSLSSLQSTLNALCNGFGVTCRQLPTITQAALDLAAQFNMPTEMIRYNDNDPPALIAANPPLVRAQFPIDLSALTLTPLAFVSSASEAEATQLGDRDASSFFYAVTSLGGTLNQPHTLYLIYEDLSPAVDHVVLGQDVADISLPLVVLNGSAESVVPTTLKFLATCSGTFAKCVTSAMATGNFSGKGPATYSADQIGLNVAASFGTSPISSVSHVIFQVNGPLIVTGAACPNTPCTDPLYFQKVNPYVYLVPAFSGDETGFIPKKSNILGPKASVGFAPFPAPLCPNNQDCSSNPPQGVFGFCANLPDKNGNRLPAVAAFAAIANSGETLVSAPVGFGSTIGALGIKCP
jgi:hypothetical protein